MILLSVYSFLPFELTIIHTKINNQYKEYQKKVRSIVSIALKYRSLESELKHARCSSHAYQPLLKNILDVSRVNLIRLSIAVVVCLLLLIDTSETYHDEAKHVVEVDE